MQRYPVPLVRQIEAANATWRFEHRVAGTQRKIVCYIIDKDTEKVICSAEGSDELNALQQAAALAEKAPKPLTDREMAARIAELEGRLASVGKSKQKAPEGE